MHTNARNCVNKISGAHSEVAKEPLYLQCCIRRIEASQFLKQLYGAQTIGEVASEQFFWMHSGFEVALKQPEQAHTGFEVALERQHCQFEPAVAAT